MYDIITTFLEGLFCSSLQQERDDLARKLAASQDALDNALANEKAALRRERVALQKAAELKRQHEALIIAPPEHTMLITDKDIRELLTSEELHLRFRWDNWDNDYPIVSWQDWDRFIKHDDTQAFKYKSTGFDCNRFASVYFGRALAWGGSVFLAHGVTDRFEVAHMWNWLIGFDHKRGAITARHLEPQTDKFWTPSSKPWSLYRLYG